MKLKLNTSEFMVIHHLLNKVILIKPNGMQAIILHGVLFRIFKKFHSMSITVKGKYTISLKDDEAAAFYLVFTKEEVLAEEQEMFTINLIRQITNAIHQKLS